jgi:hypothetical protein
MTISLGKNKAIDAGEQVLEDNYQSLEISLSRTSLADKAKRETWYDSC